MEIIPGQAEHCSGIHRKLFGFAPGIKFALSPESCSESLGILFGFTPESCSPCPGFRTIPLKCFDEHECRVVVRKVALRVPNESSEQAISGHCNVGI